jgi:hypothetical protein
MQRLQQRPRPRHVARTAQSTMPSSWRAALPKALGRRDLTPATHHPRPTAESCSEDGRWRVCSGCKLHSLYPTSTRDCCCRPVMCRQGKPVHKQLGFSARAVAAGRLRQAGRDGRHEHSLPHVVSPCSALHAVCQAALGGGADGRSHLEAHCSVRCLESASFQCSIGQAIANAFTSHTRVTHLAARLQETAQGTRSVPPLAPSSPSPAAPTGRPAQAAGQHPAGC